MTASDRQLEKILIVMLCKFTASGSIEIEESALDCIDDDCVVGVDLDPTSGDRRIYIAQAVEQILEG